MSTLKGMSLGDCALRMQGTWVLVRTEDDEEFHPFQVREVRGEEVATPDGYWDTTITELFGTFVHEEERHWISPEEVSLESPVLGYLSTGKDVVYLERSAERQNRAGLPAGSTYVLGRANNPVRLDQSRVYSSCIVAAFTPRKHSKIQEAVFNAGTHVVSKWCCVESSAGGGVVYGPAWTKVGTFTIKDGAAHINTKHPHLMQTLLSGG